MNLLETIINECTFQGITLLNKLRQIYYIDILDEKINIIETKYFRGILILYPNEWEVKHNEFINKENPDVFNIVKFLKRLITKPIKEHNKKLLLIQNKILMIILLNPYIKNFYQNMNLYITKIKQIQK